MLKVDYFCLVPELSEWAVKAKFVVVGSKKSHAHAERIIAKEQAL